MLWNVIRWALVSMICFKDQVCLGRCGKIYQHFLANSKYDKIMQVLET